MKIFRASSQHSKDQTFVKALLCGASGAGKTTTSSKAPLPLVIEPSPQAVGAIRNANPEALIVPVKTMEDVNEVRQMLSNAHPVDYGGLPALSVTIEGQEYTFQTVVLDDLEEIQDLFKRDIQGTRPKFQLQDWVTLTDRLLDFLRQIRQLQANVICCVKVDRKQEEDSTFYELALQGSKFKTMLPGLFNLMGFQYRRTPDSSDGRERVVGFNLPERYLSKGHPALDDVESTDVLEWWAKLRDYGETDSGEKATQSQLPSDAPRQMGNKKAPKARRKTPSELNKAISGMSATDVESGRLKAALEYVKKTFEGTSLDSLKIAIEKKADETGYIVDFVGETISPQEGAERGQNSEETPSKGQRKRKAGKA